MAVRCIDNKNDFELIEIITPDEDINKLCNDYIQTYNINVSSSIGFNGMLLHVSNHITVNREDLEQLEYYFNIYIILCSICHILPDLTGYSVLINIPYETIKEWRDGQVRTSTHTHFVKKANNFCKNVCVTEAGRGNVGAIYVSKAIHGLSDQAPAQQLTQNNLYINAPLDKSQLMAEMGGLLPSKPQDIVV